MLLQLPLDDLTELVIAKGMVVHDYFGPGVFETVYKRCLGLLLVEAGLIVEIEKSLPVRFRSLSIECGYRVDLLVENKVVVEVKAVRARLSSHCADDDLPAIDELSGGFDSQLQPAIFKARHSQSGEQAMPRAAPGNAN